MTKSISKLKNYFKSFVNKDLDNLNKILNDDIELIDWVNTYKGKDNVLKELKNIFDAFEKIELYVIDIFSSVDIINDSDSETDIIIPKDKSYACEIKIIFDNGSPLRVMDLIEFDDDFKIKKLTAYNRNFSKT